MKLNQAVRSIMTADVRTIQHDAPLIQVVKLFRRHKFRHIPVVQGNKIKGIVSSTDINRLSFGNLFDTEPVEEEMIFDMLSISQVMAGNPVVVDVETSIADVAAIFVKSKFHALPVVEGDELRGIVTTTDIIRFMLEQN